MPIRQTTQLKDAATLAEIGQSTFVESFGHLYSPENLSAFLRDAHSVERAMHYLNSAEHCVWLHEDQNGITDGYCIAGATTLPVPNCPDSAGELCRLYVRRSQHGSGIGGQLLAQALTWMSERFEHHYISVYQKNDGAIRLYRRHGFEIIHEYKFMVGQHADPEFIMHCHNN